MWYSSKEPIKSSEPSHDLKRSVYPSNTKIWKLIHQQEKLIKNIIIDISCLLTLKKRVCMNICCLDQSRSIQYDTQCTRIYGNGEWLVFYIRSKISPQRDWCISNNFFRLYSLVGWICYKKSFFIPNLSKIYELKRTILSDYETTKP